MINMTDALALAILKESNPNSHLYSYPPTQSNRQQIYVWCLYDNHCLEFLTNVIPFLINKRREAKILRTFLVAKRRRQAASKDRKTYTTDRFQRILVRMWELLKKERQQPLNAVNSVEALKSLDLRQYRAKREDVEQLHEGVTTRLRALISVEQTPKPNKITSAAEQDIV
jgi:hypothetical protein